MKPVEQYLKILLRNIAVIRERAGISTSELEEKLILGPGWITSFEIGETVPSIDMILAILYETNSQFSDLLIGLPDSLDAVSIERFIRAEQSEQNPNDLTIHFQYANFDASYTLPNATVAEFAEVIKTLRDGLSRLALTGENSSAGEAIKRDAVTTAFLRAMKLWRYANPSDVWYFIIYRAYCDPFNHPARYARLAFEQSWKRTGGWALEEVLVRHYGPFLKENGIKLFIADNSTKRSVLSNLQLGDRLEADKLDVLLLSEPGNRFLGVVHVKASFAERRTDDVPMSTALSRAGYISPLWTMDCKSTPSYQPRNRGELGGLEGRRSAKRMDIEQDGYFTGCFSYNLNTIPSPASLPPTHKIYVCNFRDPDDTFSRFIIEQRKRILNG